MADLDARYYKRYGSTLSKSNIVDSDAVRVPLNSVVHYVGIEHTGWFPSEIDINPYCDKYLLGHITELTNTKGNPKKINSRNTKKAPEQLRKPIVSVNRNTSVVLSYYALNHAQYTKSALPIWHVSNVLYTATDQVNSISKNNNRTQYLLFDAPERVITAAQYDSYAKMNDRSLNNALSSPSEWIAVELHKWLIGMGSVFSMFPFDDVNLVLLWHSHGKHVIMSLNYLDDITNNERPEAYGVSTGKVSEGGKHKVVSGMLSDLNDALVVVDDPVVPVEDKPAFQEERVIDTVQETIKKANVDAEVKEISNNDALKEQLDRLSEGDQISAKQYKKMLKASNKPLPNGFNNRDLDTYAKLSEKDKELKPKKYIQSETTMDSSMNQNVTGVFDKKYVEEIKDKHMASVISSFQTGGVTVNKHEISQVGNIMGTAEVHKISVTMIDGGTSTIPVKLPTVKSDGTYRINGVEYRMRKQRIDIPIRKTSPTITQLLSYFGVKQFVTRSPLAVDDPYLWMAKKMYDRSVDTEDSVKLILGSVYDNHNITPDDYGQLARHINTVTTPTFTISFNYALRDRFGEDKPNAITLGKHKTLGTIWMGNDNRIFTTKTQMGSIYDLLELDAVKAPKSTVFVKIAGKRVYIAALLGYLLGITKLIKILDLKVSVVKPRARVPAGVWAIPFHDCKLLIVSSTPTARLIIAGMLKYRTRDLTYAEMDKPSGYEALLVDAGITHRQTSEYTLCNDMFVDPITKDYLVSMKEPTKYIPLMIRACELLTTADHSDTADKQRIRGYERFPGAVYSEMVKSIRIARTKNNVTARKIEMSPYAVWSKVKNDSSKKVTENTNPIMQLRDVEAVIISGDGGRSSDTLTVESRKYHKVDVGTLSESVPDNGDVGLVSFLTTNPDVYNIYGDTTIVDKFKTDGMAQYYSTSYALTAGAGHDDPPRLNFIAIQNQHTVAIAKMELSYVRTGYESILPQRLTSLYSTIAEQPGVVKTVNEHGLYVVFKDGTELGIELGIIYSRAEGALYPNEIITNLTVGEKFKTGYPLAYHSGFFEQDVWDGGKLLYKQTRNITTALYEGSTTYEDSCSLDKSVIADLTSSGIKPKEYMINFDEAIHSMVKVGQRVDIGDTLFVLEDSSTATGGFEGSVLDSLKDLDASHPKSKVVGVIDKIECIYHGTISDMSPTLAAVVRKSNLRLKAVAEATGNTYHSGQVDSEYSYKGTPLQPDICELRVYTKVENVPANGDKFVLGLQLKCTVSDVTDGIRTESGTLIEAGFSGISVAARVVGSYNEITTASTLLKHLPGKLLEIYNS